MLRGPGKGKGGTVDGEERAKKRNFLEGKSIGSRHLLEIILVSRLMNSVENQSNETGIDSIPWWVRFLNF